MHLEESALMGFKIVLLGDDFAQKGGEDQLGRKQGIKFMDEAMSL